MYGIVKTAGAVMLPALFCALPAAAQFLEGSRYGRFCNDNSIYEANCTQHAFDKYTTGDGHSWQMYATISVADEDVGCCSLFARADNETSYMDAKLEIVDYVGNSLESFYATIANASGQHKVSLSTYKEGSVVDEAFYPHFGIYQE